MASPKPIIGWELNVSTSFSPRRLLRSSSASRFRHRLQRPHFLSWNFWATVTGESTFSLIGRLCRDIRPKSPYSAVLGWDARTHLNTGDMILCPENVYCRNLGWSGNAGPKKNSLRWLYVALYMLNWHTSGHLVFYWMVDLFPGVSFLLLHFPSMNFVLSPAIVM